MLRGLGDWQLALFVADLLGPVDQQRKVYQELWDDFVLAPKDPWLGVALALRMQRIGLQPPMTHSKMLQSWMNPTVFEGGVEVVAVRSGGLRSCPVGPGLQELELVISRLLEP